MICRFLKIQPQISIFPQMSAPFFYFDFMVRRGFLTQIDQRDQLSEKVWRHAMSR